MFGFGIYDVLIIAVFLGIQSILSSKSNLYWGAILPILFVIWRTGLFVTGNNESFLSYILILIIGLLFLLGQWTNGRISLKERQEKELNKMQAHDLK